MRKREKAQELKERRQRSWNEDTTGRELERNYSEVRNYLLELSFKAVQLLTGHGNMGAYLPRFRLRDTDGACP